MTSPLRDSRNDPINYALKLLSLRGRSVRELSFRLKRKGFSEEEIERTIEYLTERGFLDDRSLAEELLSYCQEVKHLGPRGVKEFLKKRGIEQPLIEELTCSLEDDQERAFKLAERFYKLNRAKPDDKIKRRLYGYLYRRGYSYDTIREVLKRLYLL